MGYGNWINGNDYEQTQEVFGILPFDTAVCQDLGMLRYNEQFVKDQNPRHQWLSKQQQVRYAILPIHTRDERLLFHLYAENSPLFTSLNGQPDFTGLCKRMNEHADGKSFFYKVRYSKLIHFFSYYIKLSNSIIQLPEYVKTYYKTWQDYQNEKVSVTLSNVAVSRIREVLENSTGNLPMISALIPQPLADTIKSPSQRNEVMLTNSGRWQVENLLDTHRLACSSVGYRYIQSNPSSIPSHPSSTAGSRKRKAQHPPEGDPTHVGTARKARRCMACENTQCPGRWKLEKCTATRV